MDGNKTRNLEDKRQEKVEGEKLRRLEDLKDEGRWKTAALGRGKKGQEGRL